MPTTSLNHVNISTHKLDETRDFFVAAVGLREGPRPPFSFPGHWLYCGDTAVVHLAGLAAGEPSPLPGGAIDHVSFLADGFEDVRERLQRLGCGPEERIIPGGRGRQLFVRDPNGVLVELTFLSKP